MPPEELETRAEDFAAAAEETSAISDLPFLRTVSLIIRGVLLPQNYNGTDSAGARMISSLLAKVSRNDPSSSATATMCVLLERLSRIASSEIRNSPPF